MKLEEFQKRRAKAREPGHRKICLRCLCSLNTCYCRFIRRFDPKIRFVILIHRRERQNRIATGRLSYLCLENSLLLEGCDFTHDQAVNEILANPKFHSVILYPGEGSINISSLLAEERAREFPQGKELVVFVIDGTWFTAPKILQLSKNLQKLPRISFEPGAPSRFRIRRQPEAHCHSTVEAIHHTIELLGPSFGFDLGQNAQENLLFVFDQMVEQQISYAERPKITCQWSPGKRKPIPEMK